MPYKPELHDADSVLRYYDESDYTMYSVYAGAKEDEKLRRFSYDNNDKIEGRSHLENSLHAILSNPDNTNTYMLALYDKKGKIKECKQTISFQLNKSNYIPAQSMGYQNQNNLQLMQMLHSLESKLNALEMRMHEPEEEEEEEEEEENLLGAITKNPQFQNMIMANLMNLFNGNQNKVQNIAGIESNLSDEDKLRYALDTLAKYDDQLIDDLVLLSDMAKNNTNQFNFLLTMLRK